MAKNTIVAANKDLGNDVTRKYGGQFKRGHSLVDGDILGDLKFIKNTNKIGLGLFECKCGRITEKRIASVKYGTTRSCGCTLKLNFKKGENVNGFIFINADDTKNKNGKAKSYWQCKCGNVKSMVNSSIKNGVAKSCGCSHYEDTKKYGIHKIKHNMSKTSEFKTWAGIINRCTNPNIDVNKCYFYRGIKVCDRWLISFENFL